jgi:hypothetical protein
MMTSWRVPEIREAICMGSAQIKTEHDGATHDGYHLMNDGWEGTMRSALIKNFQHLPEIFLTACVCGDLYEATLNLCATSMCKLRSTCTTLHYITGAPSQIYNSHIAACSLLTSGPNPSRADEAASPLSLSACGVC